MNKDNLELALKIGIIVFGLILIAFILGMPTDSCELCDYGDYEFQDMMNEYNSQCLIDHEPITREPILVNFSQLSQ